MRVPNLVELGRRPNPVRYVWIVVLGDGSIKSGATWMMLRRTLEDSDYEVVKVIDINRDKVLNVTLKVKSFMEVWREHYFDPNWQM